MAVLRLIRGGYTCYRFNSASVKDVSQSGESRLAHGSSWGCLRSNSPTVAEPPALRSSEIHDHLYSSAFS